MDAPNLFNLLSGWPIASPLTITPLAGGTNNQAWSVATEDRSLYVLRLISGAADLPRFRYEAALLSALAGKSLPFCLPLPLQTRSGAILVLLEQDDMEPAIATLTPFFPGSIPERNASNIVGAGVALAQLDAALATIPGSFLPVDVGEAPFMYGDLYHCHPLVSDPLATTEQLIEPALAGSICAILRQAQEDWQALSAQVLPRQLLHRDYGPGNVLMEKGRVAAILDFEFAGMDVRVFDLCVAISWWPVRLMGTGREWELIDAFGRAYISHFPLAEQELLALPAALRMRDTTSLVYRMGRYLAGLETAQTIQERVQHSLWRETWLAANHETLLRHAMSWGGFIAASHTRESI